MKRRCIGDKLQIQCYKHNKEVHRAWDEAVLLKEEKDYMVFGNDKTTVIEADCGKRLVHLRQPYGTGQG